MRAWRMYESKNPDRECRCPVCNGQVDNIGEPLPMRRIAELLAGVREECRVLKGLAEWNQATSRNTVHLEATESDALLIDFGQSDEEIPIAKNLDDSVIRDLQVREKPAPLTLNEISSLTTERKATTSSSPVPSVVLSPWPLSPEDFNPADIWESEAKERDFFRLSDSSLNPGNTSDTSRQEPKTSDYFFGPTSDTTPGDFGFEDTPLTLIDSIASENVQVPKVNGSSISPPSTSQLPVPSSHVLSKIEIPSGMTEKEQSQKGPRTTLQIASSPATPQATANQTATADETVRGLGQTFGEGILAPSSEVFPDPSSETRLGAARADATSRPSINTALSAVQTSSTSPLKHTISSNTVTTEFPPVERLRSPISPQETRTTPVDTRSRTGSVISDTVTSPSSPSEHSPFWRKASFSTNLRRFSVSSGPRSPHRGDSQPLLSNEDGFPDPGPTTPMRSFYLKTVAREQVGVAKKYQATAISETCFTVALITPQDFSIYAVGEIATSRLICYGANDGKYGKTPDDARKDLDAMAHPRDYHPTFVRAVMSDRVLCIACAESCVDIYITTTGRRIGTIQFPQRKCSSLKMSPNGEVLAVGMETGEVLLYNAGSDENFVTTPVMLNECDARAVNAIAFSPNSVFLATCGGNLVNIYRLGGDSPRLLSRYNRHLTEKQCRSPYYGVTAIALYATPMRSFINDSSPTCTSLLVVSDAEGAYPVIVNNIIYPEEHHDPIPLEGKDTYKFKNCCATYSPSFNAALIVTRAGTVKLVNCGTGNKSWHVAELGERLDVGDRQWQYCAIGFSKDGNRALALDRRGKIMMADFS